MLTKLRSRVVIVLLLLGAAGCHTTSTVLREEAGHARLEVSSAPDRALVVAGEHRPGRTPLILDLPLKRVERLKTPGEWYAGWWLFGTGLAGTVAGVAAVAWGAQSLGSSGVSDYSVGRPLAFSLGASAAVYGAIGLIAGIVMVSKYRPQRVVEAEPAMLPLRLERPGLAPAEAQLFLGPATLGQRGRIHFASSGQGWQASGLSVGTRLVPTSAPLWPEAPRVVAQPPASAPAGSLLSPDLAVLQQLRQRGETCYRRRDYRCAVAEFERALAMAPAPAMRFNLASAQDKLGLAVLAVRQYRRYLEEAGRAISPTALSHIQRRMKQLLPKVSRLQLVGSGGDLRISIDGVPIGALDPSSTDVGTEELVLEPGTYQIDAARPGRPARSIKVELQPGELRALELRPR